MKRIFLLFVLAGLAFPLAAQDISFFHRKKDDLFSMPQTQWGMTKDEYQLLSRNVRLMDWFYGAAVPGYVHFRAKDYTMGYTLVGIRAAGYGGLAWVALESEASLSDILDGTYKGPHYDTYKYVGQASLVLIFGSYLFDMIHGNYRMKRKQELIRYKYSTKLKLATSQNSLSLRYDPPQMPVFGLSFSF